MEYRVLARKYRPASFADLIGQETLVRTVSNAIKSGRIAHAFLLTGIRGVGKTTTARIIARALTCVGPDGTGQPTIEPCGVCPNCQMIAEDRHVDVLEMDAASRTGVGDIRELIDTVRYLPASARYKIYIIDEVHMLSTPAFNALLKTLEEPPPHVKFIFATTESRKIPVTILSRCQRFDLKRVGAEQLAVHLSGIAQKEQVAVEEGALKAIALAAEGSVRDALSLLDQAIARGTEKDGSIHVEEASVRQMMGSSDHTLTFRLLEALLKGEIQEALKLTQEHYQAGADPLLLTQDCLDVVHLITRVKVAPQQALADATLSQYDREAAKRMADATGMPALTRLWQMLLKGIHEVRMAPSPLAAFEMLMVRVAYAAELPTPAEVIRNSSPIRGEAGRGAPHGIKLVSEQAGPHPNPPPMGEGAEVSDFASAVALFAAHREALLYTRLRENVRLVAFEPEKITLRIPADLPRDFAPRVEECLREWTGRSWKIIKSEEEGAPPLREQEQAQKAQQVRQAAEHPLVAAALEQFPGAKVVGVKVEG